MKSSHRLDGRLTFVLLLFAGWRCHCLWRHSGHLIVHHKWKLSWRSARSCSKVPIAPMGDSRALVCLQGGGVSVWGGSLAISSCTIRGNTADYVRTHVQKFHRPHGRNPDVLAPTHACTTANASGQLLGVRAAETLKISIAPGSLAHMPKSTLIFQFGSIFVLPGICTCHSHTCKLPITPMGILLT